MVRALGSSHDQYHVFLAKTYYSHNNILPTQEYKWESVDETLGSVAGRGMGRRKTCHPRGSRNIPSRLRLWKPHISAGLMGN